MSNNKRGLNAPLSRALRDFLEMMLLLNPQTVSTKTPFYHSPVPPLLCAITDEWQQLEQFNLQLGDSPGYSWMDFAGSATAETTSSCQPASQPASQANGATVLFQDLLVSTITTTHWV